MAFDREQFSDLYPFAGHWLQRDGLRLHYLDEGAGEPVLCLHGNPTWSFYYRGVVAALRDRYRVIAPDHIGCGLSDKPEDAHYDYTLQSRVRDVEALLEQLGVEENLTLVLHDWGGMIGMAVAVHRPERIARIVLMNTAAFAPAADWRMPLRLRMARVPAVGSLLVRGLNAFAAGAARMATVKGTPARIRAAYVAPYDSWATRIATLRFVQDIPWSPADRSYPLFKSVEARLHELADRHMLILWGERDFVFDVSFLREWRRRFPGAESHSYADAGHYLLEDAGDDAVRRIRDFLERHPLSSEVRGAQNQPAGAGP
jgi:haloalkane dehalogenase